MCDAVSYGHPDQLCHALNDNYAEIERRRPQQAAPLVTLIYQTKMTTAHKHTEHNPFTKHTHTIELHST